MGGSGSGGKNDVHGLRYQLHKGRYKVLLISVALAKDVAHNRSSINTSQLN